MKEVELNSTIALSIFIAEKSKLRPSITESEESDIRFLPPL